MDKSITKNNLINLQESLEALHDRRMPIDGTPSVENFGVKYDPLYESITSSISNDGLRYILSAMQPIPASSTIFLCKQGEIFSSDIICSIGLPLVFYFQGSVPLNIHIRSSSDLDILFIHSEKLYVPEEIYKSRYTRIGVSINEIILNIKNRVTDLFIKRKYSFRRNDKSIKVSNCLPVNVDIVPACWYHTIEYQRTGIDEEKGVTILKEQESKLIQNYPFKHIGLVSRKNLIYNDKIGKCIRLLKNIKADIPDSSTITLSSFDITSFVYYIPEFIPNFIRIDTNNEFSLAKCLYDYLKYIISHQSQFSLLRVPDQSRIIFDLPHKMHSLQILEENLCRILQAINHST
ncbi:hypothetical protein [uncultured Desulfovibrio sp.]|uniref:hypothetical protein n=3 Tax=uncultured Desulfovibrio sp. TaxID=167968 RepID=UPI0025EA3016|nr:hypothetical protein [uncultured Desulfovibrio sp.]